MAEKKNIKPPGLIKLAAMWRQEKNGKDCLVGFCQEAVVYVFKNKYKQLGSNQPDYFLYVGPKYNENKKSGGKKEQEEPEYPFLVVNDDDTPF